MLRDGTVFEDEHLPREIVGRNSQMNEVTDALAPVEDGGRAENCFLFGPSGAGKTTVARAAVRELRREVLDVPTAYVNCWKDYTRNSVLERAANALADDAVLDAEAEVRQKTISKLNDHQRVLYECIEAAGPLIQTELYEQYEAAHPDPITLRALRKSHLPKLEQYNLIETERGGVGKSYRLAPRGST